MRTALAAAAEVKEVGTKARVDVLASSGVPLGNGRRVYWMVGPDEENDQTILYKHDSHHLAVIFTDALFASSEERFAVDIVFAQYTETVSGTNVFRNIDEITSVTPVDTEEITYQALLDQCTLFELFNVYDYPKEDGRVVSVIGTVVTSELSKYWDKKMNKEMKRWVIALSDNNPTSAYIVTFGEELMEEKMDGEVRALVGHQVLIYSAVVSPFGSKWQLTTGGAGDIWKVDSVAARNWVKFTPLTGATRVVSPAFYDADEKKCRLIDVDVIWDLKRYVEERRESAQAWMSLTAYQAKRKWPEHMFSLETDLMMIQDPWKHATLPIVIAPTVAFPVVCGNGRVMLYWKNRVFLAVAERLLTLPHAEFVDETVNESVFTSDVIKRVTRAFCKPFTLYGLLVCDWVQKKKLASSYIRVVDFAMEKPPPPMRLTPAKRGFANAGFEPREDKRRRKG